MSPGLFLHYTRLRFKERMEYRSAFIIGMAAQIIGYAATYLVLWLTLQRFETIGGWDWPEIALLYSLNVLTYALGAAFTYSPMTEMEKLIRKGTFDPILIRPRNPYMTLIAQMFNVGYLGHILLSGGILIWCVSQVDITWTLSRGIFLVLSILSGMLIQAALLTFIGAWSITLMRADVLFWLNGTLRDFLNYPLPIFSGIMQIVLTTVIPIAFVNFYPATILLDKGSGVIPATVGWLAPLVGPAVFALSVTIWMRAINRYQGAGG